MLQAITPARGVTILVFAIIAIGSGVFLGMSGWPQPDRTLELSGLILAAMLIAALALQHSSTKNWATVPPSFVIDFTALLLLGPNAMMVVATAGAVMQWLTDSTRSVREGLFHVLTVVAAAQTAGLLHHALGGTIGTFAWPAQGLPIALAVAGYCVVKSASAEIIVPLVTRQPINRTWPIGSLPGAPGYFIAASLAVGVAAIVNHRLWEVATVAAVPLYFAYRAYSAHVIRIDEEYRRRELMESLEQGMSVLKRSEERLALAAEGANDGLWEWDLSQQGVLLLEPMASDDGSARSREPRSHFAMVRSCAR